MTGKIETGIIIRVKVAEIKRKVRLPKRITGDFPFQSTRAEAGVYDAYVNPHGAVLVKASNGELLGVKPDEFVGNSGQVTKQIGNAVPVNLAAALVGAVLG